MLYRLRRRITYANVMSTIAVVGVLAGGGAYAASKVGPKEIKKNAVRAKHIKGNQVRAKHIKRNAVNRTRLAESLRPRWAVVTSDGSLARGRGAVDADRSGLGSYEVTFDRELSGCAAVVSVGGVEASLHPQGWIPSATPGLDGDKVLVTTVANGGLSDASFHLQVLC